MQRSREVPDRVSQHSKQTIAPKKVGEVNSFGSFGKSGLSGVSSTAGTDHGRAGAALALPAIGALPVLAGLRCNGEASARYLGQDFAENRKGRIHLGRSHTKRRTEAKGALAATQQKQALVKGGLDDVIA
jgi:hypothetical protein